MAAPLRILHLEDNARDAERIRAALEADGLVSEVMRVQTQADFVAALERRFDIILADYTLPAFDGLSALKSALHTCPEVPFIFVSGTPGEDVAIEALKVGATDYLLKERLAQIGPSVQRALREAKERGDRQRAEALLAGEKRLLEMIAKGDALSTILDALCRLVEEISPASLSSILLLDPDGRHLRHGAAPSLDQSYIDAIDGLTIGPVTDLGSRSNDTLITSKVKARFVEANRFQINHVKVVTERGVVYLMGVVRRGEGDAASDIASTTSGVQRVVKVFEYIAG